MSTAAVPSLRKQQLTKQALDYLVTAGASNLSLRPLAAQIGSSSRLLIFHYGTKDGLIKAIVGELHVRLQNAFAEIVRDAKRPTRETPLERFWQWATSDQQIPYIKLLYELQVLALHRPEFHQEGAQSLSAAWIRLIQNELSETKYDAATATLFTGIVDGLMLEFLSTGDRKRTTAALEKFVAIMRVHLMSAPETRKAKPRARRMQA
jgi:AcrR family transcriptional regulator